MMTLKITMKLDNAAFEPDQGPEVARILRKLAFDVDGCATIKHAGKGRVIRALNGDKVGLVEITGD
jgi:hypothetical protein